jgi:anti-sigma B factor antagonist
MHGRTPSKMQTATRQVGDITIVDEAGRITSGEGNLMLQEIVRELIEKGNNQIILDLHDVEYVDSSGLGELVEAYTTVCNEGGQLALLNPSKRVNDLLQLTRLAKVFDIAARMRDPG